ncbi:MAG: histidine ammonia-lyase, partial [Woeseiaceae bacterium]
AHNILAIELLAASQGIEVHHPKHSSAVLESVIASIRAVSPRYDDDRSLSGDIARVAEMIHTGLFCEHAASVLPAQSE